MDERSHTSKSTPARRRDDEAVAEGGRTHFTPALYSGPRRRRLIAADFEVLEAASSSKKAPVTFDKAARKEIAEAVRSLHILLVAEAASVQAEEVANFLAQFKSAFRNLEQSLWGLLQLPPTSGYDTSGPMPALSWQFVKHGAPEQSAEDRQHCLLGGAALAALEEEAYRSGHPEVSRDRIERLKWILLDAGDMPELAAAATARLRCPRKARNGRPPTNTTVTQSTAELYRIFKASGGHGVRITDRRPDASRVTGDAYEYRPGAFLRFLKAVFDLDFLPWPDGQPPKPRTAYDAARNQGWLIP